MTSNTYMLRFLASMIGIKNYQAACASSFNTSAITVNHTFPSFSKSPTYEIIISLAVELQVTGLRTSVHTWALHRVHHLSLW